MMSTADKVKELIAQQLNKSIDEITMGKVYQKNQIIKRGFFLKSFDL